MNQLKFNFDTGKVQEYIYYFIPIWDYKKCCKNFDRYYCWKIINDEVICNFCKTTLNKNEVEN